MEGSMEGGSPSRAGACRAMAAYSLMFALGDGHTAYGWQPRQTDGARRTKRTTVQRD